MVTLETRLLSTTRLEGRRPQAPSRNCVPGLARRGEALLSGCRPELPVLVKMVVNDLIFCIERLAHTLLGPSLGSGHASGPWAPGPLRTGAAKRRWPSLGPAFWKRPSELAGPWKRARPPGRKSFGGGGGESVEEAQKPKLIASFRRTITHELFSRS